MKKHSLAGFSSFFLVAVALAAGGCAAPSHSPTQGGRAPIQNPCSTEGEMASSKSFTWCCEGLTPTAKMERVNGECVRTAPDANVCTKCGDGVCGVGENDCSCPADCHP